MSMPMVPLVFTTLVLVLPTVLHRWEHARISPHLPVQELARGVWAMVLSLVLAFAASLFALSVGRGHLANILPLALIVVLLFPWPITRYVLIPIGAARAAWHLSQLAGWMWRGDVPGGQLVAATWAALRRRVPDAGTIAWLQARRDEIERLEAAGVLGSALLSDLLGDHEQARRLVRSIASFDDKHCPPIARYLADEWLIADAAARAEWAEVELLGRAPNRRSRAARSLGAAAARLIGYPPVPTDAELILRWLIAPRRIASLSLLRRALATPRIEVVPETRRPTLDRPLPTIQPERLFDTHARSLLAGSIDGPHLLALGRAWDRALADPELRERTVRRSLALRGGDPELALQRLGRQVEADLLALARHAALPLATLEADPGSLRRVARTLRQDLLDELALLCEALERRVQARSALPLLDELREFLSIREHYDRVTKLGGSELVRVAFSQVHDPLCALAVWLWDERGETAIATAMFAWLMHEATIAGDEEAAELQRRNVACGY